jgi:uncharacterized SAM-binding protein YcdF (DUF218 family)
MTEAQTIVVLGGGRFNDGSLTNLSLQRLDAAINLFNAGEAPTITVLGGSKSTYLPGALGFEKPGAEARADYLVAKGIPADRINQIPDGRDTIGEAITCRDHLPKFGVSSLILVTSTLHMPRSKWLFETILGSGYQIQTHGADCGGLLLADEETSYLRTTQEYFASHPGCLEKPGNWHESNPDLYTSFKAIHDRFHPPGKESEAYAGVVREQPTVFQRPST